MRLGTALGTTVGTTAPEAATEGAERRYPREPARSVLADDRSAANRMRGQAPGAGVPYGHRFMPPAGYLQSPSAGAPPSVYPDEATASKEICQLLATLYARSTEGYIEVFMVPTRPWAGAYPCAHFRIPRYQEAARYVLSRRQVFEVYFSIALRVDEPWYVEGCRHGGDAVQEVPAVCVDIDGPEGVVELVSFALPPSIVVQSGSPGHLHAYWVLDTPTEVPLAAELNESLATRLGGDLSVTTGMRRLPGTINRKQEPFASVRLAECTGRQYSFEAISEALAEPLGQPESARRRSPGV